MRTGRDPVVILWAGLAAWLATTLPTWLQATGSPRFPVWLVAWVSFSVAFAAVSRARLSPSAQWAALGVESASVVAMVGLLCNGYEGTLLVLVAAQIALRTAGRVGGLWIAAQSAALAIAIALHWTPRSALLLVPPYLGFQVFGFLVFRLLARETAARHALATSNAELLQLHAKLAERSRADERLRLAQELHDALGHRLTALSLNLEVAAHQTTGEAHVNVRTAQSLVRLALGDVREIVTAWKPPVDLDLRDELVRMAAEIPEPSIHVAVQEHVQVVNRDCSHALLRCAQEVVTNAIRHGRAHNVWIELNGAAGALELLARDDGQGTSEVRPGDGLAGMRRRFEQLGGTLAVESQSGAGFVVRATLPDPGGVSA